MTRENWHVDPEWCDRCEVPADECPGHAPEPAPERTHPLDETFPEHLPGPDCPGGLPHGDAT